MPNRDHEPSRTSSTHAPAHDADPIKAPMLPSQQRASSRPEDEFNAASRTVSAIADVLKNGRSTHIDPGAHPAAWRLYYVVSGRVEGEKLATAKRLALLDDVMRELAADLAVYMAYSADYASWAVTYVKQPIVALRESLRFQEAQERVDGATLVGGRVLDVNASIDEQAAALHAGIPKLVTDIALVNEWAVRLGAHELVRDAMAKPRAHSGRAEHAHGDSLVELQNLLLFVDGFLTLGDAELQRELQHSSGARRWATRAELVKSVVEIVGGGALVATTLVAGLAKATGNIPIATMAFGAARHYGESFSGVVTAIEVVHNIIVLFNPHASRQEKLDAGVGAASGVAYLAGSTPVSFAIFAGYEELKLVLNAFWNAAVSVNAGLMIPALQTLQRHGVAIASAADRFEKATALSAQEKDPGSAAVLHKVADVDLRHLGAALDALILDCAATGFESGVANHPGAYLLVREIFAPVIPYRGATARDTILEGTKLAIARLTFTLSHAGDVIVASTKQQHLLELERTLERREKEGGRHE